MKNYDFSIVNKTSSAYFILRTLIPLLIFLNPNNLGLVLTIYLISILMDSLDDNVIELTSGKKLLFKEEKLMNAYNLVDKVTDFLVNSLFILWANQYLPLLFKPLLLFQVYRLIGLVIFMIFKRKELLALFPSVNRYLLLLGLMFNAFTSPEFMLASMNLLVMISLAAAFITEVVIHLVEPSFMERF